MFFYFRTGLALTIQRSTKRDCVDITAATAKETPTGGIAGTGVGWACTSTESVIGIELSQYQKADCSDDASKMTIASGQCTLEGGDVKTVDEQKISCTDNGNAERNYYITFQRFDRGDVTTSPKCEIPSKNKLGVTEKMGYTEDQSSTINPDTPKYPCKTFLGSKEQNEVATPAPAGGGKKQNTKSDASTNVLATGFAVAGLIVSLVLM